MENGAVYGPTTEPRCKEPRRPCGCTRHRLKGWRLPAKVLQPFLSLLAVIFEEIVEDCSNCGGLYFFEFTSCTAFLLSLLILCVYCTVAYETFGKDKVEKVNFWAMLAIGVIFLLASIVLAATNSAPVPAIMAYVFGFFASMAFLAEVGMQYWDRRKQSTREHPQNSGNTQGTAEIRPLNEE
uniref:CKLF like MARVEL transmembrane domain containing 6 n=1 Tax=Anas platyrhynchos TaxID=8839 RepID=A0A8B9ZII4_ANAPL